MLAVSFPGALGRARWRDSTVVRCRAGLFVHAALAMTGNDDLKSSVVRYVFTERMGRRGLHGRKSEVVARVGEAAMFVKAVVLTWTLLNVATVGIVLADNRDKPDGTVPRIVESFKGAQGLEVQVAHEMNGHIYKIEGNPSQEAQQTLEAIQKKNFYFEKRDWTVKEILQQTSAPGALQVRLSAELQEIGIERKSLANQSERRLSFKEVVGWLSKGFDIDLRWQIADEVVFIITADQLDTQRESMRAGLAETLGRSAELLGERHVLVRVTASADSPKARKLRDRLDKGTIHFNFEGTPLRITVQFLREMWGYSILLSEEVQRVSSEQDLEVSASGAGVKNSVALDQILRSTGVDLRWRVRDEGIHIMTAEEFKGGGSSESFYLLDIGDILMYSTE